jgi:hypothetical protein
MSRMTKQLIKRIAKLEKLSAQLRRRASRNNKKLFCMESITMWVKLITVVISLMLLLYTVSSSFTNIK